MYVPSAGCMTWLWITSQSIRFSFRRVPTRPLPHDEDRTEKHRQNDDAVRQKLTSGRTRFGGRNTCQMRRFTRLPIEFINKTIFEGSSNVSPPIASDAFETEGTWFTPKCRIPAKIIIGARQRSVTDTALRSRLMPSPLRSG